MGRIQDEHRPTEANKRQTIGHFEIDTVLSGKAKAQALAVFVDRKSSSLLFVD